MTAIIIVEILLLAGMIGLVFWFNTKKYKDMQEWRARNRISLTFFRKEKKQKNKYKSYGKRPQNIRIL